MGNIVLFYDVLYYIILLLDYTPELKNTGSSIPTTTSSIRSRGDFRVRPTIKTRDTYETSPSSSSTSNVLPETQIKSPPDLNPS